MAHPWTILRASRRLVAAFLLIVAAAHASAPFGQPLERTAGSAFSGSTADVSLLSRRQATASVKRVRPARPLLAPPPAALRDHDAIAPAPAWAMSSGLGQTGPPDLRTGFSPLSPRAPPAA
jgi:hypothetical protein